MLKGIGASQGYGIGNAVVISDAKLDYNHVEFTTAQNEKERLQKAVDTFIKETRKLADDVKNSAGDNRISVSNIFHQVDPSGTMSGETDETKTYLFCSFPKLDDCSRQ